MARFNEILAGRYNRFLQKLFQLKGGPPSAQLASEVMPVFPFFSGVEHRYLEGWNRWYGTMSVAAIAAVGPAFQFRNPLTSNVIMVFERLSLNCDAQTFWLFSESGLGSAADLVNVFVGFRVDSRQLSGGSQGPTTIMSSSVTTVADLGATIQTESSTAFLPRDIIGFEEQEFMLLPGDAIRIRSTTVNQTIRVSAIWRERALEESEVK